MMYRNIYNIYTHTHTHVRKKFDTDKREIEHRNLRTDKIAIYACRYMRIYISDNC